MIRPLIGMAFLTTLLVGCASNAPPPPSPAPTSEAEHGHKPGAHGGIVVPIGRENYHAEVVFEAGGVIRLYMLGQDETRVQEVEAQELAAFVTLTGAADSQEIKFTAEPQAGDTPGKTSRFTARLPKDLHGKTVKVTIPNVRIGGERFRIAFTNESTHVEAKMPNKLGTEEERKVFFEPGGLYTEADIRANGRTLPAEKYRGIRASHDDNPRPGEKICPISKTKANPKFTWVIGGKTYEFCCVPCVEEFVVTAKEKPEEIRPPEDYVQK